MRILFVGEKRSPSAIRMGVTWEDKRLAAKQLFEAFDAAQYSAKDFLFCNLWDESSVLIDEAHGEGVPIVGMGRKVQKVLKKMEIPHWPLVHPAARGKIRKKENYARHVGEVLFHIQNTLILRRVREQKLWY